MKNRLLIIALPVLLQMATGCFAGESALVSSCEESIKKGLASPSSYSRISLTLNSIKTSPEAYANRYTSEAARNLAIRSISDKKITILESSALIEFEASNRYGRSVRSEVVCSVIHKEGDDAKVETIDGKPSVLWMNGL